MTEAKGEPKKGIVQEPVTLLFDDVSKAGDLTAEMILARLMTSDKNLAMIANISQPEVLTVVDVLIDYAGMRGYQIVAEIWSSFTRHYRENSVAKNGKRAEQIIQGVVADFERMREDN